MKTFTYNYNFFYCLILFICFNLNSTAQSDSTLVIRSSVDTTENKLNMDATFNRPFLSVGKLPVALGGYFETNTQYAVTDGVSDGFSFQFRRLSIFLSSTIGSRLKFLTEIEFEDGAKEINVEYAAMDLEFHSMLNLRSGIIINPIGAFNQNHDGPKWDFIDRPISSTTIIPSTLSNAGFGLHGKYFFRNWIFGYETYLTNGFDDKIISNNENRTSLAAGKINIDKFEESNNGVPMFTGKLSVRNRKIGEVGFSYLTGVYNKFQDDGLILDTKRSTTIYAFDFNTSFIKNRINLTSEFAKVMVEVPETYSQQFGEKQVGCFVDLTATIIQHKIFNWDKAKFNLVLRAEYADYNQGKFRETGDNIADDVWAIVGGASFRPVGATVIRFNYRYLQQTDLLGNPPASSAIIQFGVSSYF